MADLDLLQKLFSNLYAENEAVRNAAASRIYDFMLRNNMHPSDLKLNPNGTSVYEGFQSSLTILEAEIRRLSSQIAFARQHLDPTALRMLAKIGGQVNRWPELEALLIERIGIAGALPGHWKRHLADVTGCTSYMIERWQDGTVPIPEDVFTKLAATSRPKVPSWDELERVIRARWANGSDLPGDWRNRLSKLVGVTLHQIGRWESGAVPVPADVLKKVRPTAAKVVTKMKAIHVPMLRCMIERGQPIEKEPIAEAMNRFLGIDAERLARESFGSARHQFAPRMSELCTPSMYGKALVQRTRGKRHGRTVLLYSVTDFGRELYAKTAE